MDFNEVITFAMKHFSDEYMKRQVAQCDVCGSGISRAEIYVKELRGLAFGCFRCRRISVEPNKA